MRKRSMKMILAAAVAASLLLAQAAQAQEQNAAVDEIRSESSSVLRRGWSDDGFRINGQFFPFQSDPAWTVDVNPRPSFFVGRAFSVSSGSGSTRERRLWRTVGGISGGFVGFMAYAPRALSDSRINVEDAQRITEWTLVTAGATYLGYLIGRAADR